MAIIATITGNTEPKVISNVRKTLELGNGWKALRGEVSLLVSDEWCTSVAMFLYHIDYNVNVSRLSRDRLLIEARR